MSGPILTSEQVGYDLLRVRGITSDPPPEVSSPLSSGDILRDYTDPDTDYATISAYNSYPGTPNLTGAPYPEAGSMMATFTLPASADDVGARVQVGVMLGEGYPYDQGDNAFILATSNFGTTSSPVYGSVYAGGAYVSHDGPSPGSGSTITLYASLGYHGGLADGPGLGYLDVGKPFCSVYIPAPETDANFYAEGTGPDIFTATGNAVVFAAVGFGGVVEASYYNQPITEVLLDTQYPTQLDNYGAVLHATVVDTFSFLYLSGGVLAEQNIAGGPNDINRYFIR